MDDCPLSLIFISFRPVVPKLFKNVFIDGPLLHAFSTRSRMEEGGLTMSMAGRKLFMPYPSIFGTFSKVRPFVAELSFILSRRSHLWICLL